MRIISRIISPQAIANTIATNVKDIYEQTPALKSAIAALTPNGVPGVAPADASVVELFEGQNGANGNGSPRPYSVDEVVGSSFESVKVRQTVSVQPRCLSVVSWRHMMHSAAHDRLEIRARANR